MMYQKFLGIVLMLLLCSACQDAKKEKTIPLEFGDLQIVEKSDPDCDISSPECTGIILELLRAEGRSLASEAINKALKEHVINTVALNDSTEIATLKELTERFIADYKRHSEAFPQEPAWEVHVTQRLYRKDEDLISIGINTYIFQGGAHGYKNLSFLNFDPQSGDLLTWKDLFTTAFKEYVESKFREEFEIPAGENINSTGFWFKNDIFHLPSSIGFTKDKVLLVYNTYEIGPYADGEYQLEIPFKEVRPFLKKEH